MTSAREEAIKKAIAAGKHIYTEKPTATGLDGALELARLAEAKGIKHGVVQDKLFLPGLLKLKRLIDGGFFGVGHEGGRPPAPPSVPALRIGLHQLLVGGEQQAEALEKVQAAEDARNTRDPQREASINDVPIEEKERRIRGPRPESERGRSFPLQ